MMRIYFKYFVFIIVVFFGQTTSLVAQTEDQVDSFSKAAKFDDVSEVNSLLAKGISPNTLDSKGNPMLLVAIRDNSTKVINLLLANSATNVNLPNKTDETPLMMASFAGSLELDQQLVQRGAQINRPGWTPLHYACSTGKLNVVEYLLEKGANVNALSPSLTTPLMMAVNSGNEQVIKYLLDKGADLKLRNTAGFSAIDVANLFGKEAIRDGLISRWYKLYKDPYPGGPIKNPS